MYKERQSEDIYVGLLKLMEMTHSVTLGEVKQLLSTKRVLSTFRYVIRITNTLSII
jgi:hypothetical protein